MGDIFGGPAKTHRSDQTVSSSDSASFGSSASGGASNSTSNSYNQAYGGLSQSLQPQVDNGTGASNALRNLLGIGGDPHAQQSAFNDWRNSTGYQFGMDQGMGAITGSNAAKGLLNSGATLQALNKYGQDYASTKFQDYLNPLQALIGSGNQAAGVISGAGNVSNSDSTSNQYSVGNTSSSSRSNSNGMSLEDSKGESKGWGDMAGNALGDVAKMFL